MYSNLLMNLFNDKCDINGEINAAQTQEILYKIGLPFNRTAMIELYNANIFGMNIKLNESEKQKRITTNYEGLVRIIIFYLTGASFPGYRRPKKLIDVLGKVKDHDGVEFIGDFTLSMSKFFVEDFIVHFDQLNKVDDYSDSYSPNLNNSKFPINIKITLLIHFLQCWFFGLEGFSEEKFYTTWELVRDRLLMVNGRLPLHNQYQQDHTWQPRKLVCAEKGRESLVTSILSLEYFIKTAPAEDVRRLQCWFEIILAFENGSGFIISEAKAALKNVPTLNQDALISDWYLLAYIYYYSMNPIKFKYGVAGNK